MIDRGTTTRHRLPLRKRWLPLLVAPLLASGCGLGPAPDAVKKGGTDSGTAVTAGDTWTVVTRGSATPSPQPTSGATPAPTVTTRGFLPLSPAGRPAVPSATCGGDTPYFNRIGALAVVPGTTSAVVSWYNVGGYNIVEFRITALSQDMLPGEQRDVGWVTVKPDNRCGYQKATVPNLARKTRYIFSVDVVVVRRSGEGTHAATIFRSSPVQTK